jgi:hypothetical protein
MAAWYAPEAFVFIIVPVAIASWAFYTSLSGRLITSDLVS